MGSTEKACDGSQVAHGCARPHLCLSSLAFLCSFSLCWCFSPNLLTMPMVEKPSGKVRGFNSGSCGCVVCRSAGSGQQPPSSQGNLLFPPKNVWFLHPKQIGAITEGEGGGFTWRPVHQYHHLKPQIFYHIIMSVLNVVFSFFLHVLCFIYCSC